MPAPQITLQIVLFSILKCSEVMNRKQLYLCEFVRNEIPMNLFVTCRNKRLQLSHALNYHDSLPRLRFFFLQKIPLVPGIWKNNDKTKRIINLLWYFHTP